MQHASLARDSQTAALSQLGSDLVEKVGRWHEHGLLHRDLSVSNVGLAPDGKALIWDFPTMATVSEAAEDAGRPIGTPLYMAYSAQAGQPATQSSELESIMYILIQLSLKDGALPWQGKAPPEDRHAKYATMVDDDLFRERVRMTAIMSSSLTLHACRDADTVHK